MTVPVDPGDFVNGATGAANAVDARFLVLYNYLDKSVQGVDASAVLDGIVTRALIEAQPVWSTVALVGTTWTPANLSYYKDSLGIVHFRPESFSGTADLADGTTITTLPAGSRPGVKIYIPIEVNDPAASFGSGGISIDTSGVVRVDGNGGIWPLTRKPRFTAVEFRAEN
jgi:hypothetical protein